MNKSVVIALALIGGFIVGIVLSELIAVVGKLMFDRTVGIKFLPVYTAFYPPSSYRWWCGVPDNRKKAGFFASKKIEPAFSFASTRWIPIGGFHRLPLASAFP